MLLIENYFDTSILECNIIIQITTSFLLFVFTAGSLVFSSVRMNKLNLDAKYKRNLMWKVTIYQILTLLYSCAILILFIALELYYAKPSLDPTIVHKNVIISVNN